MVIYSYHVSRKKKTPTFSLLMVLLSRFGPFWVWGVTIHMLELHLIKDFVTSILIDPVPF